MKPNYIITMDLREENANKLKPFFIYLPIQSIFRSIFPLIKNCEHELENRSYQCS
jgi:hypothetical protein